MKKFLKIFFSFIVYAFVFGSGKTALSASTYPPSSTFSPNTSCPQAPGRAFVSICGEVTSSLPLETTIDGDRIMKPHMPVDGVSVYVYECDNLSPSCKNKGNLVHPFSSTVTDKDGKFYLVMRKLDNYYEYPSDSSASKPIQRNVMSKRRYLVFNCGGIFAGLQVIPSYLDQISLRQEVKCYPGSIPQEPPGMYALTKESQRLAIWMGTDEPKYELDPNGRAPGSWPNYTIHMSAQFAFKNPDEKKQTAENGLTPRWDFSPTISTNFDLKADDADPRFIKNTNYITQTNFFIEPFDAGAQIECPAGYGNGLGCPGYASMSFVGLERGSFWARDCYFKYKGVVGVGKDAITNYCMSKHPQDFWVTGNSWVNESNSGERGTRINDYYDALIGETDKDCILCRVNNKPGLKGFVQQDKLPNIPPKNSTLFYKELPAREDLHGAAQDPTDIAKFLGTQFSNCIGKVTLKNEGVLRVTKQKYLDCERLKECSRTLGIDNSGPNSWINSFTTNGPGYAMQNPYLFKAKYESDVDTSNQDLKNIVCASNPDDPDAQPIYVGEIQPPWVTSSDGYKLNSSYWSPELMYYFGKNNVTTRYADQFNNYNDSYDRPDKVTNRGVFRATWEAESVPPQGGTFSIYQVGGKKPNNTMAGAVEISTNPETGYSTNSLVNVITSPAKETDPLYRVAAKSGTSIYSGGSNLRLLGEYSRVNFLPEKLVIGDMAPNTHRLDENSIFSNVWFSQENPNFTPGTYASPPQGGKGNQHHFPKQDHGGGWSAASGFWTIAGPTEPPEDFDGWRTSTAAIYVTTAADRRTKKITGSLSKADDFYDSILSAQIGEGKVDLSLNFLQIFLPQWFFPWVDRFLGENTEPKNHWDRKQAVETLNDEPGLVDDLKTKFTLSEENFPEVFPLPLTPDEAPEGSCCRGWGDHLCYPWTSVPVNTGLKCNTDNYEAMVTRGPVCTGSERYCRNLMSRTCRIDECTKQEARVNCTTGFIEVRTRECTDKERYECAAGQESYIRGIPINEVVFNCGSSTTGVSDWVIVLSICRVSKAGPNMCAGNLTKDAEFKTKAILIGNSEVNNSIIPPSTVDAVNEADNELRMQWEIPIRSKVNYSPLKMISTDSSVKVVDAVEMSKGKDTFGPGGDSAGEAILREMFWAPSKADTDSSPTYDNYKVHCYCDKPSCSNTILNSTGNWECTFEDPPNPEIIDLEQLNLGEQSCNINPSPACRELVFGNPEIEFSDSFVKVMGAAGAAFKIPPSLLLSIMAGTGNLSKYNYYFSKEGEDDFINVTAPWYGTFNKCDDMNPASQGPYDWILQWFNATLQRTGAVSALNSVAQGRGRTASRCNFLDASYVLAANLTPHYGSCSAVTWESVREAILTFMYGGDRVGAYEDEETSPLYAPGGLLETIFRTCRY